MARIVQEILNWLERHKALKDHLNIQKILLNRTFATVQLTNGCVGTALNYDYEQQKELIKKEAKRLESDLLDKAMYDRLLYKTLLKRTRNLSLTEQAVKIAILSALSRPFFKCNYFNKKGFYFIEMPYRRYTKKKAFVWNKLFRQINEGDIATVIGFGGFLKTFVKHPKIKKVYVTDKNYKHRMKSINKQIKRLRKIKKQVYFKKAACNKEVIQKSDIVSITASAMCNDTMDDLLKWAKNCRIVIIQGVSGGVVPFSFFKKGISFYFTETKNKDYLRSYISNGRKYYWYTEYDDRIFIAPKK
jgi:uncharacterized protein (DUF4213/DUF364 family)